ncbi:MAG TPA: hypothetical protein VIV11_18875 [Kofleriaceae bacterium]
MKARVAVVLGALAGCAAAGSPEPPRNTATASPPPASACPRDGTSRLTIVTGALPAGCSGGSFTVDGEMFGEYPVACAKVPAGLHTVGVASANDCAGYMKCKLELAVGETVLDLRSPSCL